MALSNPTHSTPVLYVFNISHYCEKARWGLNHFGIAHEVRHVMVGQHRAIAKKLGARRGSVPFLQHDKGVVSGSSDILDWCETQCADAGKSLGGKEPQEVRALEDRLDRVAGVHARRFFYSDALLTAPQSVRPLFSDGLPILQRMLVRRLWSRIVPMMIKGMDLGPAQGRESAAILDAELAWLDEILADGRPYLTGSQWTRADLTAASLLSPLAAPKEHPLYLQVEFPPGVSSTMREWADRPALKFVQRMYAQHRNAGAV